MDFRMSVVMPVYNAGPYLDAAVTSILNQDFCDFCLILTDDQSNDGSWEQAEIWAQRDSRISVFRNPARLGPVGNSNAAANRATTEYVARMDADDVATPDRLSRSIAVLDQFPECALVGSLFELIGGHGQVIRTSMATRLARSSPPVAHTSIVYRKAAFDAVGGYRAGTEFFEDSDLYRRIEKVGDLLIINAPLVGLRFAGQNTRLQDDPASVEKLVNRHFRNDNPENGRHIDPSTYYTLALLSILAGKRPQMLRRMIKHMAWTPFWPAFKVMAMVTTAKLSPHLLRHIANGVAKRRERSHSNQFVPSAVYRWSFDRPTVLK